MNGPFSSPSCWAWPPGILLLKCGRPIGEEEGGMDC
jgi:hypothetical protein